MTLEISDSLANTMIINLSEEAIDEVQGNFKRLIGIVKNLSKDAKVKDVTPVVPAKVSRNRKMQTVEPDA